MTPEQKFWNYLREKLPGHVSRIENTAGNGMPDINLCSDKTEIWIELKAPRNHKTLVRKEQRIWGLHRSTEGGRVFILSLSPLGLIQIWKYPNIEFVKHDDKYQEIVSPPMQEILKGSTGTLAYILKNL